MTLAHPEESWQRWAGRVAVELDALDVNGFATYAVRPDPRPDPGDNATSSRKGWRRRSSSRTLTARSTFPASEVLMQVSVVEGVLALECIGDTEFEGHSDLSPGQQSELLALGWEQDELDPTFSKTFSRGESEAAADLLARTLREVLEADRPSQVDTRHA